MPDNGNKTRPVRTLTVKNFSVIKEAKLEFGKITVLIGPQASGKSLLCKLAYFFQRVVVEQAHVSMRGSGGFDDFHGRVLDEFSSWFPAFGLERNAEVSYEDGQYKVKMGRSHSPGVFDPDLGLVGAGGGTVGLVFSDAIRQCYEKVRSAFEQEMRSNGEADFKNFAQEIEDGLKGLQSSEAAIYTYVPSTRSFFVTAQKAVLGTNQRLDPITVRFSQDFSYDYAKRIPQSGLRHDLAKWIDDESRRILQGAVQVEGNSESFRTDDGRELPLSFLSSGTQELLPLMTCLREYVSASAAVARALDLPQALHSRLFFVEEPETDVFPSTQYDLIRVFTRMANEPPLDASWVITTHSPYVLSSFNNLIYAGQLGQDERLKKKIKIDERYWVEPGTFRAYSIHDGKSESILSDSGLIDGDYLDSVSETIGNEFDELLRLEYGKKKAS